MVISRYLVIKDERKLWPASGRIVIASRGMWTWSLHDTVCIHAHSNSCNKQDLLQPMWPGAGFSRRQHRFDSEWTKWHWDSTCFLPALPFDRCSIFNHLSSTVIILTLRQGRWWQQGTIAIRKTNIHNQLSVVNSQFLPRSITVMSSLNSIPRKWAGYG